MRRWIILSLTFVRSSATFGGFGRLLKAIRGQLAASLNRDYAQHRIYERLALYSSVQSGAGV